MKRMKLSELTGNEILAQSLMTWDYQIILPEGAVLKKEYIDKIEEMGILEVYVKEDEANEIVILKNASTILALYFTFLKLFKYSTAS